MSAQLGGTAGVYHESAPPRIVKRKPSGGAGLDINARLRKKAYSELAFCRLMLQRKRARGDKRGEEYWREEAARARRNASARPRQLGVVVYPGMRAEVDLWVRMSLSRPLPTLDTKRAAGPDKRPLEVYAGFCARCESI